MPPRERRGSRQTLDASWSQCRQHRSAPGTQFKGPLSNPWTTTQQLSWEGEDSNGALNVIVKPVTEGSGVPLQSFHEVRSTGVVLNMNGQIKGWMDGWTDTESA